MKTWTKTEIRSMLETNDKAVVRGVLAIYAYQTETEQRSQSTLIHNNVGFNGADAEIMSSFAEWIKKTGKLTDKQLALARKKMIKYSQQLVSISNQNEIKKAQLKGYT